MKKRYLFTLLSFLYILNSCTNLADSPDSSSSDNSASPSKSIVIFNGSIGVNGAVPSELQCLVNDTSSSASSDSSRSAMPTLDFSDSDNPLEYFAKATASGKAPVEGVFISGQKVFTIPLETDVEWEITAGVREKNNPATILISDSFPVKLSASNTVMSHTFFLIPTVEGKGSLDLWLEKVPEGITNLKLFNGNEEWLPDNIIANVDSSDSSNNYIMTTEAIDSGVYEITLKFYNGDILAFATVQTINVFDNMTTNTWIDDGTGLIEDGKIHLTSGLLQNFLDTTIYVGDPGTGKTPDDTNAGTAYTPLASVNAAIKRIRNANVSRDYRIFVSGSISGNVKIGGGGDESLPTTAASSITIQGLNNNNAEDVLTTPLLSTEPCLSIQTDIPVIFKNIKITTSSNSLRGEYNTSAQGGGLYIKTGADAPGVTLDSGALIDGCIISGTEAKGAGIYLDSGKLTIKTGAKISNNHFPNSNGFGGGIYITSEAELILSGSFDIPYGGSVTQNDIYVEAADSIKIKSAISPQTGTSGAMATITPAQDLQRGVSVVSLASGSSLSSIAPYKDYFALSNNDWIIKANSAGNALVIDAPIYVAGVAGTRQVCTENGSATGNGTKSAPFAAIEQAVNAIIALNAEVDYTIYVDGVISGHQTIPSTLTSGKASSLTIQGASGNTNDILNGNNTTGSVLTISSTVPVTIKDLKITGGKNADGAGIKAEAEGAGAYLILDQGSLITENNAGTASGGGVSIKGGTFIMRGNAEISECRGTWGGGIRAQDSDAPAIGTIVMLGGNASIKDCTGSEGGGIGLIGSRVFLYVRDNAEISGNSAISDGGGIRLFGSTANISGGLIKENKADSAGGAVSVKNDGVLNLSGSVWIPEGVTDANGNLQKGSCKNDIYLADSLKITIKGVLTPPAAANGIVASITPQNWTRGTTVVQADNTHVTDLTPYKDYFAFTNKDWSLKLSSDKTKLSLDAPFYVSGQETHPYTGVAGSAPASAGGNGDGTKSHPFDTIQNAVNAIAELSGASTTDYTILIDGELKSTLSGGYAVGQDINSSVQIQSITIKGVNGLDSNGDPIDVINGQADATHRARGITFHTDKVPVTIECLKITNGLAEKGGGIYLSGGAELTLGDDVLVTGNDAKTDGTNPAGGGIYIGLPSTLKVKGNARVIGNTMSGTQTPSNVHLLNEQKIQVVGTLTNESNTKVPKAKIGVSTEIDPTSETAVTVTSGYNSYNAGVNPGVYFRGDKYGVKEGSGDAAGEAVISPSGGALIVESLYKNIQIKADKTSFSKAALPKTINFTAVAIADDGTEIDSPLTIAASGDNNVVISAKLSYHGESVKSDFYSVGTGSLELKSGLAFGDYTLYVSASYKGRSYSASFPIVIRETVGTKSSSQEKAVGDIVFNDGSAMPYTEYAALDDDSKNDLKTKAIALIFYNGTGLNSGSDTTTKRTLGMGLGCGEILPWCSDSSSSRYKQITPIRCYATGGRPPNIEFTTTGQDDRNGSDNLEQIADFLGTDDDTSTEENYPVLYWAKNYKDCILPGESSSRIKAGSAFENGWYLPSSAELYMFWKNGIYENAELDLNTASQALGGIDFTNKTFMTSSQSASSQDYVDALWLTIYAGNTDIMVGAKDGSINPGYPIAIREF